MMRVRHLNPSWFIDIDGMVQKPEDLKEKYGWAFVGERAVKMQIVIGTVSYAVMAAYTMRGKELLHPRIDVDFQYIHSND